MVSATPTHTLFSVSNNSAFATSVSDDKSQSKIYCFSHSTKVMRAFADIGIGTVLCLFCLLGIYSNSPYIVLVNHIGLWGAITIGVENTHLTVATIHYDYVEE